MMNEEKPVLTVRILNEEDIGTQIYGSSAEIAMAWAAATQVVIEVLDMNDAIKGDRREAMHGMLDKVLDKYEEELKEQNKKEVDDSFEKFKDDFFKEMPEVREKFEGGDLLAQAISDALLRGAYEALKETKKR